VASKPQRIVSLVPSITENLILFGCTPVGRTSFCIEPKNEVKSVPVVGGTKTPRIKKIKELKPDLVIANKEENRKEDIEALQEAGLNVWVTYPVTVKASLDLMRELRDLCPDKKVADEIIDRCKSEFDKFKNQKYPQRSKVVTFIWKDPWMVAGGDTYMDDLTKVVGGENPFKNKGRYPAVTEQEVVDSQPDLVLLPSEPYEFKDPDQKFWKDRLRARVEFFSGEDLCWFGPRISRALPSLARIISNS
jgi:ABC-type Fe3+-hydroxamate transport system substrate-binding protein